MTKLRYIALLLLALAFAPLANADKPKGGKRTEEKTEKKLDAAKLIGDWKVVEGWKMGEKADDEAVKADTTITKTKITVEGKQGKFEFSYTTDTSESPATIDLEILEPESFKGAKAKGIFSLKKGELKLCYSTEGDRPTKFESPKESKINYFILKRVEKKEKSEERKEKSEEKKKSKEKKMPEKEEKTDKEEKEGDSMPDSN